MPDDYLAGVDAETFDIAEYVAANVDPRLLQTSEGRRLLTRLNPILFACLYLGHHLRSEETEGQVTFADFHLELLRYARTWLRPLSEPALYRDAWVAPRGCGKPVSVDALILMGDGSRKRLGDVEVGDWVITHLGRARQVTEVHVQGLQPSVQISTRRGRTVEAAIDHPFLTQRGWVLAGDLTTEDKVVTVPSPRVVTGESPCEEEFALAGYFIGDGGATMSYMRRPDGTLRSNGINSSITVADDTELAHLRKVVEKLGFSISGPFGRYSYHVGGGAQRWLHTRGIAGTTSHDKRVPQWVFRAPAQRIAAFLAAYFACDGTVTKDGNRAEYYSVNRDLLLDVQHLLLRLGVHSTLRLKRGRWNGEVHLSWRLTVEQTARFAEVILPYLHSVKTERLIQATAKGRFNEYDHVTAVEHIDPVECRCLTVDEDHTFTANDLVVHNSTWLHLILPLWAAAHGHVKFIATFSDSTAQAEQHLANLRAELDTNEMLRADFPELCQPKLRPDGLRVATRQDTLHQANDFVLVAKGLEAGVLGMKEGNLRPELIILDDVEPGESNYSEYLVRKRLTTLTDVVLPLNVFARVVLVGTVTMSGSIVHQLVKSVRSTDEPAEWVRSSRFKVHYFPPIVQREDGTERSCWPGKWSIEWLQSIRHTRQFKKNFANEPINESGSYWTPDSFRYERIPVTKAIVSVDPAVTDKRTSDYTGIAVVGYDAQSKRCCVLYAKAVKLQPGPALRQYVLGVIESHPEVGGLLIETNQGGDTWKAIFHDMPVKVATIHQSERKEVRAARVVNHYERGRVLHAEPLPEAEEQMAAFPFALHDDITDAIGTGVHYFLDRKRPGKVAVRNVSYV